MGRGKLRIFHNSCSLNGQSILIPRRIAAWGISRWLIFIPRMIQPYLAMEQTVKGLKIAGPGWQKHMVDSARCPHLIAAQ